MRYLLNLGLLCVILAACSNEQAPLVAENVLIKQPVADMRMSAGYLTLRNASDQQIRINHIESPDLESVEMHESVLENGISRMRAIPEILIPAGQSVTFEAGAMHLMMRHPVQTPDIVTLQFFNDQTMLLSISVTPET